MITGLRYLLFSVLLTLLAACAAPMSTTRPLASPAAVAIASARPTGAASPVSPIVISTVSPTSVAASSLVQPTVAPHVSSEPPPSAMAAGPPLCPVTPPNGWTPPGELASIYHLGNGGLWTSLWPDGVVLIPPGNVHADGSLDMKFPWWRGAVGLLTITGRRLDAPASPLRSYIPDGYGEHGFQATGIIFPTEGCWEITGRTGEARLTFVQRVVRVVPPGAST